MTERSRSLPKRRPLERQLRSSLHHLARSLGEQWWMPAAAIAAGLVMIWGFAELADEVTEGESAFFDRWMLLMLRDARDPEQAVGPAWLQQAALEITALGSTPVLVIVTVAAGGYLALRRDYWRAAALVLAISAARLLSGLLKLGFDRPRPDIVPHLAEVQTLSFPSGHAMMGAVVWLTIGAMLAQAQPTRRLRAYILGIAAAVAFLVGVTRVYLGVHYPTDVLAGWAAGGAWACLWWAGGVLWQRRRLRRRQGDGGL